MTFSKEMYPKIALIKSAYAFTDRAYIHLDADERCYIVDLSAKPGCAELTEEEFMNEMLCQCVRHEVYQQTKTVRELLTARAMASTVIQRPDAHRDEVLPGFTGNETQILTDWFEMNDGTKTEKRDI